MPTVRLIFTSLVLAVAMVMAAWLGRRDRRAAVILLLLSIVWFTVDHRFEGPTLIVVSRTHGLVVSDLVGVAGVIVAVWELVRLRRRPPSD